MDLCKDLLVVATAERNICIINLNNPTSIFKVHSNSLTLSVYLLHSNGKHERLHVSLMARGLPFPPSKEGWPCITLKSQRSLPTLHSSAIETIIIFIPSTRSPFTRFTEPFAPLDLMDTFISGTKIAGKG